MTVIEGIKNRRSVRKFTEQPVARETLEEIIAASAYAPSWKNTQVARYLVIQDKEQIDRIAKEGMLDFTYNTNTLLGCSTVVILTTVAKRSGYERDGSFTTKKEDRWEYFDAGIACQTFMLAASELGVGSVVMGIFDEDYLRKEYQIPEDRNIAAIMAVGYPAEEPAAPKRKSVEELVTFL